MAANFFAFQGDLEVLKAVVEGNSLEIAHAPALQTDRDFAMKLLKKEGKALQFFPSFCGDRECVEVAVDQNGVALAFASIELRGDRELALQAIRSYTPTFRQTWDVDRGRPEGFLLSLSKELRADKDLMLEAMRKDGAQLQVVEENLLQDREVVMMALQTYAMALRYVAESEESTSTSSGYPKSKSKRSKEEKQVTATPSLLEDLDVLATAVMRERNAIQFCPKHLRAELEAKIEHIKEMKKRGVSR
ncbi:Enkurin domain-containing protein [Durusdinium trenchii]|uniref:Enkurin domain-containing protein n=1 Tax=Durusdinium trenchii TaxID=1381693 RepID=A0ABP0I252_9DINO